MLVKFKEIVFSQWGIIIDIGKPYNSGLQIQ